MKPLMYFIAVVVLLSGCIPQQIAHPDFLNFSIEEKYDEFDGYRAVRMRGNYINTENWTKLLVGIDGAKFTNKNNIVEYYIVVRYSADDWLFISEGESLIMLIDAERIGLVGDGSRDNRDAGSHGIYETAHYVVDKSILKKIASAKEVKIKIVGKGYYTDTLTQQNIANFKEFVDKYVD